MITRIVAITLFAAICICGLPLGAKISAWERANNYPFGKLCDLYRNCR